MFYSVSYAKALAESRAAALYGTIGAAVIKMTLHV